MKRRRSVVLLLLIIAVSSACSNNNSKDESKLDGKTVGEYILKEQAESSKGMAMEGTEDGAASNKNVTEVEDAAVADETGKVSIENTETEGYTLDAVVEKLEDGYYVTVKTNLNLSKDNYGKAAKEGEGHIHYYKNGALVGPITDGSPYLLSNLKEGKNVIKLELANNDHSGLRVTKEIEIENTP